MFLAQNKYATSAGGRPTAVTINDRGDDNCHIIADKAYFLNSSLSVDVVKWPSLKLRHNCNEGFHAFRPTSIDIDEICVYSCVLQVGELPSIMVVPCYVRICKEGSNSLVITAALGSNGQRACNEKNT